MTDQTLNDPDAPRGCPVAHGRGDDRTRLYGPDAATDPRGIYERLREQHGSVAPVLLEGDVPAWLVLGYRDNRRVLDSPGSSRGTPGSGGTGGRGGSRTPRRSCRWWGGGRTVSRRTANRTADCGAR